MLMYFYEMKIKKTMCKIKSSLEYINKVIVLFMNNNLFISVYCV